MNLLTHFKRIQILPLLIAYALVVGMFTPVTTYATPQCGFTPLNLLSPVMNGYFPSGTLNLKCTEMPVWLLIMRSQGDSDLYITQNTIQPNGQSGWHTHPGPSLITVIEGTVTVYEDDCTFQTRSVGESFTDIGCGDVHNIRNETAAQAKTIAVQIVPHGAARRIDSPDPGCPQVPLCPSF